MILLILQQVFQFDFADENVRKYYPLFFYCTNIYAHLTRLKGSYDVT